MGQLYAASPSLPQQDPLPEAAAVCSQHCMLLCLPGFQGSWEQAAPQVQQVLIHPGI